MFLTKSTIFIFGFLMFLPICAGLACYLCSTGLPGCNDPFNPKGFNVTNNSVVTNVYCVKTVSQPDVISRYGARSCNNVPFVGDLGTACCQTDLCNDVQNIYYSPIMLLLSCFILFFNAKN